MLRILLLEDNLLDVELIEAHLSEWSNSFHPVIIDNQNDFIKAIETEHFDVILADYSLPSFDGVSALNMVQSICPDVPFIFVSGTLGEEFAIETLKLGATDYVLKHKLSRLVPAIERALREAEGKREKKQAESELVELKNELADQLVHITRLQQFSSRLLNTLELNSVFTEVLSAIASLNNTDMAVLMLYDQQQHDLYLAASMGLSAEYLKLMDRIPFGKGDSGIALKEQRKVIIIDVAQDPFFEPYLEAAKIADYCSIYTIPLFTRNGEIFGTISTYFRNYYYPSERKMNIVELYAVQAGWAINNARLYDEAQKANRLKDEFLTTISHELRTPLTSMWGWAQLLSSHRFDENTTAKALETIENNTKTLVNIVDDILDVSKIIQGKLNLHICVFDLMSILDIVIKNLTPAARAKNIEIKLALEGEINLISGDPERVQQIIWNLVSNSIKFTNFGGEVMVKLSAATMNNTQYIQIEVIDTGIGIAEDLLPYIFDRFRQADSTIRRNYGGLGLGLALVKHLVELHGGVVFAESQGVGMGATFVVKLPFQF